jgi:hypothetical protein
MSPSQPLETILNKHLQPLTAPAALWDRVWQPRVNKPQSSLTQGFAFGLPVLAAAALIFTVAMRDPAHELGPALRAVSAAAKPANEIVYEVGAIEKDQTVRALARRQSVSSRKPETRVDVSCGLCHTL